MKAKRRQPAETVESWPLAKIVPYERNPRTHPEHQIALLARLMSEHGVDQPIVVDEAGVIIKGHGRLLAAKLAGMRTFPVVVKRGLTEVQKQAERLADNQVALLAGWDRDFVRLELGELQLAGYDIPLLGFDATQLAGFLDTNPGLTDPEVAPEPPAIPVSQLGDLWQLGRHRLLCGDATKAEDVKWLLGTAKPHLMVTDPPYGVNYDPNWRTTTPGLWTTHQHISAGKVQNDDRSDWQQAWELFAGDVGYIWHAGRMAAEVAVSLRSAGFFLRAQIIWRKSRIIIGRGDYHYNHEPCWYVVREGKTGHWTGRRDQGTVWDILHDPNRTDHGTQKPIECMKRPIENNSKASEAVYDPFVGSGTTLIAAEMTGRKALTMEIDPRYCDVVIERWQAFVGEKAKLDGIGFEQIRRARHGGKEKSRPKAAPLVVKASAL